jgi:LacI family transcriptional regulator
MARRPTIADVAAEAGVSVATVDRVLNRRQAVREGTAQRLLLAAQRLGYHAAALIEARLQADLPTLRLGVVLHKGTQAFYVEFADQLRRAASAVTSARIELELAYASSQAPGDVTGQIERLAGRVDAIAATAVNHQTVTACVSRLRAEGIPVFSLLSDFAQGVRSGYLGVNNLKVGRTAAWTIATAAPMPGKVAIFVGGHRWHGHELRETGFRSYFREFAPEARLLDPLVNLETRQLTYEATLDLLARHPDLRGLYVAGGGMEGAIAALRETRAPGEVSLVVNELTEDTRAGLIYRTITLVIATPLGELCARLMHAVVQSVTKPDIAPPGQEFLQHQIFVGEMI